MADRGRCMDSILIERLWRPLKQEAIYFEEPTDSFSARRTIKNWMTFCNIERPHSANLRRTPQVARWCARDQKMAA